MNDSSDVVQVRRDGDVGVATINRPQARNALSTALRDRLLSALTGLVESGCRCLVITGTGPDFVAGADIREMADASATDILQRDHLRWWTALREIRVPLIAAVNGLALGGGAELAMACDLVVAAESATFGQPEIKLGVMPGGGATQRLVRAVGKAVTMDLLLTGRTISAAQARDYGIVSRVVPDERLMPEVMGLAQLIAGRSPIAVRLIKDAVQAAAEMPLSAGLIHERHNFCLLFGTQEQSQAMRAFLDRSQRS
jgi:enoyl-CoA hydratase